MTTSSGPLTRRMLVGAAAVTLAAAGPLMACSSSDSSSSGTTTEKATTNSAAELTVTDVWVRMASKDGNGAIYMTIKGGGTADALTGVELPEGVAEKVEIHETKMDDGGDSGSDDHDDMDSSDMGDSDDNTTEGSGMMTMKQVDSIAIPADGTVKLEPGGYHFMMFDLEKDLAAGDNVEVTLNFESGATKTVTAEVREV